MSDRSRPELGPEAWDQRFAADEWQYGVEPNDFVRDEAHRIPPGPVVCLAEGQGRNAVHLAERGHAVTAIDFSREALKKAAHLAKERSVDVELQCLDLAAWDPPPATCSGVVAVFMHLPPPLRAQVLARAARSLRPGGVLVMEVYAPGQLAFSSGGPKERSLLVSADDVRHELAELELVIACEVEREIHEGVLHHGRSATTQVVGIRR